MTLLCKDAPSPLHPQVDSEEVQALASLPVSSPTAAILEVMPVIFPLGNLPPQELLHKMQTSKSQLLGEKSQPDFPIDEETPGIYPAF